MRKRILLLLATFFMIIGEAFAQNKVSGTVTSQQDGEPVVGASVMIEGTKTGTVTDVDGRFTLSVPSGSNLVVSYLGMKQKVVKAAAGMTVKLEADDRELSEVVVTAMGMTRDKKALGYATQQLSAEDLNTAGTTSLASAMQGKLTGVDIRTSSGAPGASANITIRGARSFDGNNSPLYVVDGMPVSSTPDWSTSETNSVTGADYANRSIDINPDDIESISVLKGQAASALYGIRASNGVILITTKRGNKNTSKPVITFSTDLSAQTVSNKFDHQKVYAQGNSINSYSPTSSMSWGPKISELPNDPVYGGNVANSYTSNGADLHQGQFYNPKYASAGLDGWVTPEVHDNVGDFFRTGFTQNSNFGISQSKNGVSYAFGISDTYQKGIVPSTGMTRTGARGAVDWEVNKQWKTGFSANYSADKITKAPGANSGIINVVYGAPAEYDLKGVPNHVPGDPTKQISYRSTSFDNPYWFADHDQFYEHTNRIFGNAYVEFRPNINWGENYNLVFREQAGIDMYTTNYRTIAEIGSAYNSDGEVVDNGVERNVFNNLFTARFNATWGSDFKFGLLLGSEFNHDNQRVWNYDGTNLAFYGQATMSNTSNIVTHDNYREQERTVGFFGQADLSWRDMLYLTVTGRNDVVSTMPRGNRSFFYPSVSLGWIFTELPALKDNKVLTYGKLRTSFAEVGQAGHYYTNYHYVPAYGNGMYMYTPIAYPIKGASAYAPYYVKFDENLKPQNTKNWEAGIELGFFDDRIHFDYTVSYQDVKDQIFDVPTSGSTGYQYLRTNAGEMTTWAHELSLSLGILKSKDYDLTLGANFSHVHNYVKKLAEGVESIFLGGFAEPQIRAQAGYTYPNIYGLAFKRADNGELLLSDGLPQATANSQNLGECAPDFNMGFNLSARYKRLSLTATLDWQKGGKMYNGTLLTMNYFGATEESLPYHEGTMVAKGIDEATGEENTVEVSKQDYWMAYHDVTEAGIYDTSFLKLRDVTLSYRVPKFWGIDLSVYAFARNILMWSNLPDLDPESSQGNDNMSGYFERFSVPNTSSFGGGFRLSF